MPSWRIAVALGAAMLGIGIAVGAAIGPAPEASLAGDERLPTLLGSLLSSSSGRSAASAATRPAPASPPAGPAAVAPVQALTVSTPAAASAPTASTPAQSPASPSEPQSPLVGSPPRGNPQGGTLAPVTSVWLIELSGESFAQALAQPALAPYISGQLVPAGTLLSSWSALSGAAFASAASLAGLGAPAGSPSPILDTIAQPACPEGPAGSQCAPGTPGQLTTADAFLKQVVAQITANSLYREHGLIVVTFGATTPPAAAGLPDGSATVTLTAQPPAGVVLLSPFARAGARSALAFDPTSPRRSLERLLHK